MLSRIRAPGCLIELWRAALRIGLRYTLDMPVVSVSAAAEWTHEDPVADVLFGLRAMDSCYMRCELSAPWGDPHPRVPTPRRDEPALSRPRSRVVDGGGAGESARGGRSGAVPARGRESDCRRTGHPRARGVHGSRAVAPRRAAPRRRWRGCAG